MLIKIVYQLKMKSLCLIGFCLGSVLTENWNCKIVINEAQMATPNRNPSKQFIELVYKCTSPDTPPATEQEDKDPDDDEDRGQESERETETIISTHASDQTIPPVNGYYLLVMAIDSRGTYIETLIEIPAIQKKEGLLTIGGQHYAGRVDMQWNHGNVYSVRSRTTTGQQQLADSFRSPAGKKFPGAIIALYLSPEKIASLKEVFSMVNTEYRNPIYITGNGEKETKMFDLISSNIIDIVVFGSIGIYDQCRIFEDIAPEIVQFQKNYCLIDVPAQPDTAENDRSLNYCSADMLLPFRPDLFRYGKPTPNEENDCSGRHILNLDEIFVIAAHSNEKDRVHHGQSVDTPEPAGESTCASNRNVLPSVVATASDSRVNEFLANEEEFQEGGNKEITSTGTEPLVVENIIVANKRGHDADRDDENEVDEVTTGQLPQCSQPAVKIRRMGLNYLSEEEHKDLRSTKFFRQEWRDHTLRKMSSVFVDTWWDDSELKLKYFLEMDVNEDNPEQTKFRCRICNTYLHRFHGDFKTNEFPKLENWIQMKDNTWFKRIIAAPRDASVSKWKDKIRQIFKEHIYGRAGGGSQGEGRGRKKASQQTVHNRLMQLLDKQRVQQMEKHPGQLAEEGTTHVSEEIKTATGTSFRAVYYIVQKNLPFSHLNSLIETMEQSGAVTGTFHRNPRSGVRMMNLISDYFHKQLLQTLKASMPSPISIILDDASDISQHHHMAVLLRFVGANGIPMIYFYKLLDMGTDQSAEGHMEALRAAFQKDDEKYRSLNIMDIIKKNLVGFGADGASTMFGRHQGLRIKLAEFSEKGLIAIHCMAHRLQLAIGAAWKSHPTLGFNTFEELLGSIYTEYSRSSKRYAEFMAAARELNLFPYSLAHLQRTRWVAADERALTKLLSSWQIIIHDRTTHITSAVERDHDFALLTLKNRNFLLYANFMKDILNLLTELSNFFQRSLSTVIGMDQILGKYINEKIKHYSVAGVKGSYLTIFLTECRCYRTQTSNSVPCETIATYNEATRVTWHDITLENNGKFIYQLEDVRFELVEKLRRTLISYFPRLPQNLESDNDRSTTDFALSNFDFLQPTKLPSGEVNIPDYRDISNEKVIRIANHFKLSSREVVDEWNELIVDMVRSPNYKKERQPNRHPVDYWGWILAQQEFIVKRNVAYMLKAVLVLPATSSDAERVFSILKHTKYDRRASLQRNALDTILRIRFNGMPTKTFKAEKYAKLWIANHHLKSDAPEKCAGFNKGDKVEMSEAEKVLEAEFTTLEAEYEDPYDEEDREMTTYMNSIHLPHPNF